MAGYAINRARELLCSIVRLIVDHPDHVEISVVLQSDRVIFQINTHPADIGKVIGAGGRTARAIRWLICGMADENSGAYSVEIIEPQSSLSPQAN